jgi:hypothetical protein
MAYQPFFIADLKSGLVKNPEAFIIPQDAFPTLENAYIWRGRIQRKSGYQLLDRLRRILTASALGNSPSDPWTFNVFTVLGLDTSEPDANIAPGTVTIVSGANTYTEPANPDGTLVGVPGGSGTIDYATGAITLIGMGIGAGTTISMNYFPGLPCMGLRIREINSINIEDLIAFDTKYSYRYNTANDIFEEWITGTSWQGNNADFFWTTNYWQDVNNRNIFWATNFNTSASPDPIRYTNGVTWTDFLPAIDGAGNEMHQCLALVPFKDRLLAFNTFEGTTLGTAIQYPQRVRFSQNGDPTDQVNGWRSDIAGRGGFIDVPTNEHIVSVAFIRDILVVGLERSTWQLRYTGNEILPFIWEKINTELGTESTFSMIEFDRGVLSIGQTSLHACDGNNVQRIDLQIPDEVFNIHNNQNGPQRVYGIRDFTNQNIYWTFPSDISDRTYPNRMLVYNYLNNTFSIWKDHYTCFGRWQAGQSLRWQDLNDPEVHLWRMWVHPWNWGGAQEAFPNIIGGNQQGFVEILNSVQGDDKSLRIEAIANSTPVRITSTNHMLDDGDFIKIEGIIDPNSQATALNGNTYKVIYVDDSNVDLLKYDATNNIYYDVVLGGAPDYRGNGFMSRLSNFKIASKLFNIYETGMKSMLGYIDFYTNRTTDGEFTCQIFLDENDSQAINTGFVDLPADPSSFVNAIVSTSEQQFSIQGSSKNWHRFYCQTDGQTIQYVLKFNDAQMNVEAIQESPLTVHALILWQKDGGRLV